MSKVRIQTMPNPNGYGSDLYSVILSNRNGDFILHCGDKKDAIAVQRVISQCTTTLVDEDTEF